MWSVSPARSQYGHIAAGPSVVDFYFESHRGHHLPQLAAPQGFGIRLYRRSTAVRFDP